MKADYAIFWPCAEIVVVVEIRTYFKDNFLFSASDPDPRFYYGTGLGPGQNNMEPKHCCPYLSWGKYHPCNKQVASALSGPKLRPQFEEKEGGG